MRKKKNWLSIILSFVMVLTCMLPTQTIKATDYNYNDLKIMSIEQRGSTLTPGETFGLEIEVLLNNLVLDENTKEGLYVTSIDVIGDVDTSKMSFTADVADVDGDGKMHSGSVANCHVSGIKYNGGSKTISVTVGIGIITGNSDNTLFTSTPKEYTLSAHTASELEGVLVIEKQENLLVKNGQTQNVEVKITNKGSFTVNQAEVQLNLDSKVKDLEVKTDTATVKNIKSKETKSANFSIKVGEDIKAGVYPATVKVAGNSYPVNVQVDSSIVPSALEVSAPGSKVFMPGVASDATFTLNNVGDRDAKNIRFEVVNSEDISIVEASNVKRLDMVKGKSSQNITMKLKVSSSYKGDSIPIQVKLNYLSSLGEEEEDVQYVYLSTSATSTASEVVISNVISPTGIYGVDENFTVKFNLSSAGGAENLKISIKGDEGIVPKSQNLFFVNKLAKGETKQYTVTFAATHQAVTSSHPIEISVEYGDPKNPITISQYGSVNISNPEQDEEGEDGKLKGKPKVIIGEYQVNPTIVQAGENFELHLGFLNTSSKHTVHNLKANVKVVEQGENDTGSVFTPVGGSNTFYIAELGKEEMVTKDVTMYTIPNAKPKTYEITLEMVYEDEDGNEITATENIGIPVEQVTKIEVGDIYVEYAQVGMETYFSASFYNRGRTDVTNMMVYIEGEGFTVEENKTFIGNFAQGDSESYEPSIMPNEAGNLAGVLVVEYEDTAGKTQRIEKPFEFVVEEMMQEEFPIMDEGMMMEGEMPQEEGSKNNLWIWVGIGVGIIAALIITLIVLKKRKAKKEEMMIDEED